MIDGYQKEENGSYVVTALTAAIFAIFWYFLSILTYGSNLPSGVFLSAIMVGCALGFSIENLRINYF
jgi:H+/Cl- antiporter ClcA